MSFGTVDVGARVPGRSQRSSVLRRARQYFASDRTRTIQTILGLVWLLDGGLQFQSFMYSTGFIHMLTQMEPGQPAWLASTISWTATTARGSLGLFNTLFALTQVAIGLGILIRRTVRPALAVSFAWSAFVWWFGEAFGMLLAGTASPFTGAPGAVALYALIGMLVWPNGRPGGLLGETGGRTAWAALWLVFGWLWLLGPNSAPNATSAAIGAAPSGMGWLSSVESWAASASAGHGLVIALVMALLSVAIAVAVATRRRARGFLAVAIVLSLVYWVLGEGLGGIFTGSGTDPNSGPLLVLLALSIAPLVRRPADEAQAPEPGAGSAPARPA